MRKVLLFGVWCFAIAAHAVEADLHIEKSLREEEPPPKATLFQLESDQPEPLSPVLTVGGRIDVGFSGGSPITQGFSISSLRLNANGSVGRYVDYGMAFAQTREFSTALLPQILPVDAFIAVKAGAVDDVTHVRAKVGMFNPMLNPWWTPDLAEVPLPDYHAVHRQLLLDNDLGAEVSLYPIPDRLEIAAGAFNGNGIFSLNTNNSKAFSAMVRGNVSSGDWLLQLGLGAYIVDQSGSGSVNFKSNKVYNLFGSIQWDFVTVGGDVLFGKFEDNTRLVEPTATAGFAILAIKPGIKVFSRLEKISNSPTAVGGEMAQFQLGTVVEIDEAFKAFLYYEHVSTNGEVVTSGQVRVRLSI